ncbi:MFS transporter [Actinomarinicola tropica]|uniref:MFS transporter n=1 Tax=Actinomarinicola tropica TaxID=2789776 RepID=A0A5Q2RPI0_9ACTN|nr:MFS transporter [Actinomarinicola tropica]QGG96346.1 MFS transporter [Actinomarinicola tropica]
MTGSRPSGPPATLYVVTGALALSNGAVFALLADFQDRFGFSSLGLGLVAGAAFASGFAAQVGLAPYADRGHAHRLLIAGLVSAAVGTLLMGVGSHVAVFVVARLLTGIGYGMYIPAARRAVIGVAGAQAGSLLGRLTSFSVGGFVLGPPLAGLAADVAGPRAPFLLLAAVVLVCVPGVVRAEVIESSRPQDASSVRQLLALPGLQAAVALGAAFYLAIGVFEAIWARLLTDLGTSTRTIGFSLLAFGIPMAFFAPIGGRLADRFGGMRTATISMVVTVPIMVAYGQIEAFWGLMVVVFVHAVADATTSPGAQLAVSRAAPPTDAAAAQGILEAAGFLMAALAAVAAAPVYERVGAGALFAGAAALMSLLVVVARLRHRASPTLPGMAIEGSAA